MNLLTKTKLFPKIIFLFSYLSIFISFYFDEDGSGFGASGDWYSVWDYTLELKKNFFYDPNLKGVNALHLPLHYFLVSLFTFLTTDQTLIRLIFCSLSVMLPIFFFLSLNPKKKNYNSLLILSSIVMILPAFRYSAIWGNDLITSLIFFQLSIFFFKKWEEKKTYNVNKNIILQCIFLCLATYSRPYFSFFFIFFFYKYFKFIGLKNLILLLFFCFILAIPAFYFVYLYPYLLTGQLITYKNINYFLLGNSSILLVYLFPIFLLSILKKKNFITCKVFYSVLISLLLFFSLILTFEPDKDKWSSGGIFLMFSKIIFKNNIFFLFTSFISFVFLIYFILEKKKNFLIIIICLFMFPSFQVYQRYYEPMFFLILFSLIKSKKINLFFNKTSFSLILYIYFFIYYLGSSQDWIYKIN